jgi:hypothetical protein
MCRQLCGVDSSMAGRCSWSAERQKMRRRVMMRAGSLRGAPLPSFPVDVCIPAVVAEFLGRRSVTQSFLTWFELERWLGRRRVSADDPWRWGDATDAGMQLNTCSQLGIHDVSLLHIAPKTDLAELVDSWLENWLRQTLMHDFLLVGDTNFHAVWMARKISNSRLLLVKRQRKEGHLRGLRLQLVTCPKRCDIPGRTSWWAGPSIGDVSKKLSRVGLGWWSFLSLFRPAFEVDWWRGVSTSVVVAGVSQEPAQIRKIIWIFLQTLMEISTFL